MIFYKRYDDITMNDDAWKVNAKLREYQTETIFYLKEDLQITVLTSVTLKFTCKWVSESIK